METTVHRFTGRDGSGLTYRQAGAGRPILLLHGFTASGMQWFDHGPGATLVDHGYHVIVPDLRGHGDSTARHDAPYPSDVLTDDGLALIDELGLDDYDLGGYSLGARIALRMMIRGARPTRAILAGQGLTAVTSTPHSGANYRILTALANGDILAPGTPAAQAAYWIARSGNDPRALLRVLNSVVSTPVASLEQISTPTLVVVGDQDHDHASATALAKALPHAQHATVPGDHWSALTTQTLATTITAFLTNPSRDS
jgi:pimeloyl-ACP methyl ester carboxylesterase